MTTFYKFVPCGTCVNFLYKQSQSTMSDSTLIGICSNNLVTIMYPSSTSECTQRGTTFPTSTGPTPFVSSTRISLSGPSIVSGSADLSTGSTLTIAGQTFTAPTVTFQTAVTGSSLMLSVSGTITNGSYTVRS